MKKICTTILFIAMFMLMTMTVFASDTEFSNYVELTQSIEYSDITAMEPEILSKIKEIYEIQYNEVPNDFPEQLDISKISKVYVDTNIEDIGTSNKNAIEGVLNQSTYVWVIPIEYSGKNFYVTLAKGLPLDESKATALTDEEKAQVRDTVGKWKITEIAERPVKPYSDTLKETVGSTSIDDTVLIGGIPGMQMPVALGFQEEQAISWVKVGYEYPVIEELSATYSTNSDVYDFDIVLQKLQEYNNVSGIVSGGATGNIQEAIHDSNFRIFAASGCLILMLAVVIFYLKNRKVR